MADGSSLIASRKAAPKHLGSVLVLGLGKTGQAVCSYCLDQADRITSLTVAAGAPNEQALAEAHELEARGARVLFDTTDFTEQYDLCIASPGISQFSDFYQHASAHADEVISEVEFAWRESRRDAVWIAITGTNGKTTTTALCAHLLNASGKRACAVGNIGATCIEAVAQDVADYYVAEVSSYQLASTKDFAPQVAVLLNITPDHIKWHKSFEAYCEAKQRIYANLARVDGVVIMDAVNEVVRAYVKELKQIPRDERSFSYIPLGTAEGISGNMIEACGADNAAYVAEGCLTLDYAGTSTSFVDVDELQIPGEHNVSNALAAASAAIVVGCAPEDVRAGLRSFEPLEHRIEACGSVDGVACYNDSKATNVDATLKALAAFGERKPIVLLGGDDKGTSLEVLVEEANAHCKAVVCYGEAGPRFFAAFANSSLPRYEASGMREAFDLALDKAVPGDIIVLSPACASFDEFSCFEERGEVFKELVRKRSCGEKG